MTESYLNTLYTKLIEEIRERKSNQEDGAKPEDLNILDIISVDTCLVTNTKLHHTDDYEQTRCQPRRLILRRGHPFLLKLHCNRPMDPKKDAIIIEFNFGAKPAVEKMTKRLLEVKGDDHQLTWKWGAKIDSFSENQVLVQVKSTGTTPVGEWIMRIHTGKRQGKLVSNVFLAYTYPDFIFFIFNPWCPDDPVFMDSDRAREEYVLNDHGAVWQGAKYNQYHPCAWNFGQFEDVSLYAALLSLRQGDYMSDMERSGPVMVARKLTLAIYTSILAGRWSEPYDDGTKPWEWTGSAAILEKYMENPMENVKYGQCWVFSGVLCTLLRTVGIPCRSVTNIRSAHDTDHTLTIDNVYWKNAASGKFEKEPGGDSVWNFHVWNEIWCKRTDLPPGYDGWQAVDATPQESSKDDPTEKIGRYQCGPMSLEALKRGEVKLNYDGWFIYGEVNADVVRWYYAPDPTAPEGRRLIKTYTDEKDVGRCVITSAIGKPFEAEEVTRNYKPEEGTSEERAQIRHAIRQAVATEREEIMEIFKIKPDQKEDVQFEFTDLDTVKFGQKVKSSLKITNTGKESRTVQIQLQLLILRYTGVTHTKISEKFLEAEVKPGECHTETLEAFGHEYGHLLQEHAEMCVEAICQVKETDQIFTQRDIFLVEKPSLFIDGKKQGAVNIPTTVTVYFTNPVNEILTNCNIYIEGCGLSTKRLPIKCPKNLAGRAGVEVEHTVIPRRLGKRSVLAVFNADQVANLRGTLIIDVLAGNTHDETS